MLRGPILATEVNEVCARVANVRGVREVDAHGLEPHETAEHVPALQGSAQERSPQRRSSRRWTPARRIVVGATGAALMTYAIGGRKLGGRLAVLGGSALLLRAATNEPARRLFGIGGTGVPIELHKSLYIAQPVVQVFAFVTDFENFPRFLQHVRRVRRFADGRSRWVVAGPAGFPLQWDAAVTRVVPNELYAWKTDDTGWVHHAGVAHFTRSGPDGRCTQLELRFSYEPIAGVLGHAVATLLGANPKRALDEDMLRFKSLLERGKTSAHGEEVKREELGAQHYADTRN
jgi:uncharacterized membrane protein